MLVRVWDRSPALPTPKACVQNNLLPPPCRVWETLPIFSHNYKTFSTDWNVEWSEAGNKRATNPWGVVVYSLSLSCLYLWDTLSASPPLPLAPFHVPQGSASASPHPRTPFSAPLSFPSLCMVGHSSLSMEKGVWAQSGSVSRVEQEPWKSILLIFMLPLFILHSILILT